MTPVWKGIVRIVFLGSEETAGLVVGRQFRGIFGKFLNSFIRGFFFKLLCFSWLTFPRPRLIFIIHDFFKVSGVDEIVDVSIGVGDDGIFRRKSPFSIDDELVLMESSGELLR